MNEKLSNKLFVEPVTVAIVVIGTLLVVGQCSNSGNVNYILNMDKEIKERKTNEAHFGPKCESFTFEKEIRLKREISINYRENPEFTIPLSFLPEISNRILKDMGKTENRIFSVEDRFMAKMTGNCNGKIQTCYVREQYRFGNIVFKKLNYKDVIAEFEIPYVFSLSCD